MFYGDKENYRAPVWQCSRPSCPASVQIVLGRLRGHIPLSPPPPLNILRGHLPSPPLSQAGRAGGERTGGSRSQQVPAVPGYCCVLCSGHTGSTGHCQDWYRPASGSNVAFWLPQHTPPLTSHTGNTFTNNTTINTRTQTNSIVSKMSSNMILIISPRNQTQLSPVLSERQPLSSNYRAWHSEASSPANLSLPSLLISLLSPLCWLLVISKLSISLHCSSPSQSPNVAILLHMTDLQLSHLNVSCL